MSSNRHTFKIAEKFYYPGPRYKKYGPCSGEEFKEHLLELLKKHQHLRVDLDGTLGYGSSFLEEGFGGLIRENNTEIAERLKEVELISNERPYLITEIQKYIHDALEKQS